MAAKKQTRNISDEERQRRREVALKLHQEGKFGGAEIARKAHEKRLATSSTELAEELRDDVLDFFRTAIKDKKLGVDARRRVIELLLRLETKERELEISERRALDEAKRTAILARVLRRIESGPGSGAGVLDGGLPQLDTGGAGPDPGGVYELGEGEWSEDG